MSHVFLVAVGTCAYHLQAARVPKRGSTRLLPAGTSKQALAAGRAFSLHGLQPARDVMLRPARLCCQLPAAYPHCLGCSSAPRSLSQSILPTNTFNGLRSHLSTCAPLLLLLRCSPSPRLRSRPLRLRRFSRTTSSRSASSSRESPGSRIYPSYSTLAFSAAPSSLRASERTDAAAGLDVGAPPRRHAKSSADLLPEHNLVGTGTRSRMTATSTV